MMADQLLAPLDFVNQLKLKSTDSSVKAAICGCRLNDCNIFDEVSSILHVEEQEYFDSLKYDGRKTSFLLGRYCAKRALSVQFEEQDLRKILIKPGFFNQPVVVYPPWNNLQVSLTHCDYLGAAIAFPEGFPMGIDMEKIDLSKVKVLEMQATEHEKKLLSAMVLPYETVLTFLWTAKEALSKIMKTGLTTPFQIFELEDIVEEACGELTGRFKNFTQYKAKSFYSIGYVCTVVFPKNSELIISSDTVRRVSCLLED